MVKYKVIDIKKYFRNGKLTINKYNINKHKDEKINFDLPDWQLEKGKK